MSEKPPARPPMAIAIEWVGRITTVALEMILPGILGGWLDDRWGTKFLALLGFAIGLPLGMAHLLWMTSRQQKSDKP